MTPDLLRKLEELRERLATDGGMGALERVRAADEILRALPELLDAAKREQRLTALLVEHNRTHGERCLDMIDGTCDLVARTEAALSPEPGSSEVDNNAEG